VFVPPFHVANITPIFGMLCGKSHGIRLTYVASCARGMVW